MDDIKYIRRLYEKEGVSIREITRRTGYHYETIVKYLDMDDFNEYSYPQREYPSLLDPLKPIIDEWLEKDLKAPRKQRHTAKKIYERLSKEYPNKLKVKARTVQYYVSKRKKEIYADIKKGYIPLTHPPGEAQVDFGKFSYYDNAGDMKEASKLTVSFPHSNAAYCQIFKGENMECLLQGIKNIIEYINVVPCRMVFDNLSAAVVHINKDKTRVLTEGFKRFTEHYKIEPVFCNKAAGWEKGNVEGKVGYERRNMFVPIPTILDFEQFNKNLFKVCDKDMHREHYSKKILISELFELDKKAMLPLNEKPFNVVKLEILKCDKYGKVMFENNKYSTSPNLALSSAYLEVSSDSIKVMDENYNIIVTHQRIYERDQESMNWIPYISLMSKRPNAIKYTGFYEELPEVWKNHLESLDNSEKKEVLTALNFMLLKHDIVVATDALQFTIDNGVKDSQSILASYQWLTNNSPHPSPLKLKNTIIQMPEFKTNNKTYDSLLSKEVKE